MYRGTTPDIILTIEDIDLTQMRTIWITCEQARGAQSVSKTFVNGAEGVTVEPHKITVALTQEDTLAFSPGQARIQVRALGTDGEAYASQIASFDIGAIIKEGVIT